jgi:hypothetical protein
MMEESNPNRGSISSRGTEIFSSSNYEAGRDVHSNSSYLLGNHFSSTEGEESEGEAYLSL